jgi:hypothetical protein
MRIESRIILWMKMLPYHKVIFELNCKMVGIILNQMLLSMVYLSMNVESYFQIIGFYIILLLLGAKQTVALMVLLGQVVLTYASRVTFDVIPSCIKKIFN